MFRLTDADGVESGGDFEGQGGMAWHDDGQRAGEEMFHQERGGFWDAPRDRGDHVRVGHVNDERVVGGAAFGAEDVLHGAGIERIGSEAVDGFGRKGDYAAGAQDVRRSARRPGDQGIHGLRLTIQAEKPSRNAMNPGRCSGGKL